MNTTINVKKEDFTICAFKTNVLVVLKKDENPKISIYDQIMDIFKENSQLGFEA